MPVQKITIIISLLLFSLNLFSQKAKRNLTKPSWKDIKFISVELKNNIKDNKIVAVDIGQKAIIYLNLKPMITEAKANLSNDFVKEYYQKIIYFFDSASLKSDTVFIDEYYKLRHLEYLVSHQLLKGHAKVYYKKQKSFVDTVTHRLERYGGNAERFFYLPDKRPFFAVLEFSGILDDNDDLSGKGHLDAYIKEGEKLANIGTE
jgi:hypothetical protein